MRSLRTGAAVVIGAAALVSGTISTSVPASAQWHRSDVGAGLASSVAPGPGVAELGIGVCTWRTQRFWDGFGWRVQRVQICD